MKKKKSIKYYLDHTVLTVASLFWIYPIVMILFNSLKKENSDQHKYCIYTADSRYLAGISNYVNSPDIPGIFKESWLQCTDHSHFCGSYSALLLHVCVVYHKTERRIFKNHLLYVCPFHGRTVPDGYVYAVPDGR